MEKGRMTLIRAIEKIKKVLTPKQKKQIVKLVVLMIIGGFLEMFSVSLIVPFIEAIMTPEIVAKNKYVALLFELIHIKSYSAFLVLASLVLAFAYLVKNTFLILQMKAQYKFVTNAMFDYRIRLLKSYLNRPYEFFLTANSGEIMRVIQEDVAQTFNILLSVLTFFTEVIVSLALIITIFLISPIVTMAMAAMLLLMIVVILTIIRPVLTRAGEKYQKSTTNMNQWMVQSIQGIKDIKIIRKEDFFVSNYSKNCKTAAKSRYQSVALSATPRFLIEAVSLGSFFVIVAILIYAGADITKLIPMLSAIAMAAVRLLPAANRISQASADISYGEPMLDKAIENMEQSVDNVWLNFNGDATLDLDFNDEIKLSDITYRYPSGESYILKHANMSIKKAQSVGIVGKSGSGKTTTIDILLGLLEPSSGDVCVDGKSVYDDINAWHKMISYIPQNIFMLDGTIKENVAFGESADNIDEGRVLEALKEASLMDYIESLPAGIETQIGERGIRISGGQRQRIGIARALYNNPSVIVLDEATSALDNETEAAIMESINNLHGKKTLIIIAHRLSTIENCDVIYRVQDGKIMEEK